MQAAALLHFKDSAEYRSANFAEKSYSGSGTQTTPSRAKATGPRRQGQDGRAKTAGPRWRGQDGRAKTAGPRRQGRATGRRRRRWVKRQRLCGYEYAQCVCRWPSEIGTDWHEHLRGSSRQTDLGTPPIAPCTRPNSTQCLRAAATTAPPGAAGGHSRERLTRLRCQHHLV